MFCKHYPTGDWRSFKYFSAESKCLDFFWYTRNGESHLSFRPVKNADADFKVLLQSFLWKGIVTLFQTQGPSRPVVLHLVSSTLVPSPVWSLAGCWVRPGPAALQKYVLWLAGSLDILSWWNIYIESISFDTRHEILKHLAEYLALLTSLLSKICRI